MKPGFLTVATYGNPPTEMPPANGRTSGRRRALAEWLVSRDNPLTARVIVNRIWHHHFGRGIVATLDNFGKMGETPTHPGIARLAGGGVHGPRLEHQADAPSADDVRDAYQMSSQFNDAANLAKDPENKLPVALPDAAARCGDRSRCHSGRQRRARIGRWAGRRCFRTSQPKFCIR